MAQGYLVTGATGFIGGHVARAAVEHGHGVATIARPASDAKDLESAGVTIIRGDLLDRASVDQALDGANVIVHCAGKVGDRGTLEEYRPINAEALQALLDACKNRPISRFIHMSSLG